MVIMAAAAGLGVGLVPEVLVQPALDAGQVIPAHSQTLPGTQSYWFSYPTYREPSQALQAFGQWVIQQSQGQQD